MKWSVALGILVVSLPFVVVCGGSSGSGGGGTTGMVAPADPPVCRSLATPAFRSSQGAVGGPGIIVPATTLERDSDGGRVAHTNHLISASLSRSGGPTGYSPAQIQNAYGIGPNLGGGAIAIVDAFHYPAALDDFNTFSNQFSLPVETSTDPTSASNSVFRVVYATGTQPPVDGGWAQESALDTQWAHALAPQAKIYLVEAASANMTDLIQAVNVASRLPGVRQVSMSFGVTETACSYANSDSVFTQPNVTYFAATGDTSGERDFPALSKNVVAVSGTTLRLTSGGSRISESAWKSSGCGLSAFEPRPAFQDAIWTIVQRYRGGADISAVGDPNFGVSVYDSVPYAGLSGWMVVGGTSAATPIVAAIVNTSGVIHTSSQALNAKLIAGIGGPFFNDVTTGIAGGFSATVGWDYPTGVGTPNGSAGF